MRSIRPWRGMSQNSTGVPRFHPRRCRSGPSSRPPTITFTSTGRGQRSSWPTDSCFSAQRTAAPGRVGQVLTHLPDAEAVCTAGCGRTSCCWTAGRVLLVRHAGHDDGWSTLSEGVGAHSEGTPNLDGLGCHIAGRLEGPDHICLRGQPELEPTDLPLMAGRIVDLRTSPTSPGAAECPALTGRRLPDLRAARRTRDLCRRDSRLRSAMDLACTCDRPRVYLAGDPGAPAPRHRDHGASSSPRSFPGLRQQRSLYLRLFARCHAVYSHR